MTPRGVPVQTWEDCYSKSWVGTLSPGGMAHPAKISRGLLERILDFGLAEGFWDKDSILGDCFGGVGTTGILCSYRGIRSVSVELEPRFYGLSMATRRLHRHKLARLGCPLPVYLRGDSRNFAALVGQCGAVVTSPPWADPRALHGRDNASEVAGGKIPAIGLKNANDYGTTPGNLGNLPAGTLDGAVTSPPYAGSQGIVGGGGVTHQGPEALPPGCGDILKAHGGNHRDYGSTPGQLGALPAGTLDGNGEPDTYWRAVAQIYQQVRLALKPGGVFVCVVKSFVKDGAIVDLPGQTAQLLTRLGFTVFLEVHALLTHEETHPGLFGSMTKKRERKSFFRRLAEKKGSPPIDHETVLFCRSPP